MDKFRDAYREASKELPQITISAQEVRDELRHCRIQRQRRKILLTKGCAAAAVFLLCGAGTVAAKSYRDSVISVRENGFVITSSQEEENLPAASAELGKFLDIASFLKIGGVFSIEDAVPEGGLECFEPEIMEYDSIDAFRAAESAVMVLPQKEWFAEEFTSERVCVIGEGEDIYMDLMNEESYFSLHQMDHRQYENYSTATSYMGESCNERNFVNSQGLNYVVFDTVDEAGELQSVHAVISVNGWDLTVSFGGFEENEIERVLNGLDLTVYYRNTD